MFALVDQLVQQRQSGFGGSSSYRIYKGATDDERRFEGPGQPLQSARRVDGIADHRERHAMLAAYVAEHGWPVIEADTDTERPFSLLNSLGIPPAERFEHHVGADEGVGRVVF